MLRQEYRSMNVISNNLKVTPKRHNHMDSMESSVLGQSEHNVSELDSDEEDEFGDDANSGTVYGDQKLAALHSA